MEPTAALLDCVSRLEHSVSRRARQLLSWLPELDLVSVLLTPAMLSFGVLLVLIYSTFMALQKKRRESVHGRASAGQRRTVSVLWDIENCCPPRTADLEALINSIKHASSTLGDIVTFDAYMVGRKTASGVRLRLALAQLGVRLVDVPNNGARKEVVDHTMSYELGRITTDAVVLLSMDRDFAFALQALADRGVEVGVIGFSGVANLPAHRRWLMDRRHCLVETALNSAAMIDAANDYSQKTPEQLVREFAPLVRILVADGEIDYDVLSRKFGKLVLIGKGKAKVTYREMIMRAQSGGICVIESVDGSRIVKRGAQFDNVALLVTPAAVSPAEAPFRRLVAVLRESPAPLTVAQIQPKVSKRWLKAAGVPTIGQYVVAASNSGHVVIDGSTVRLPGSPATPVQTTPRPASPAADSVPFPTSATEQTDPMSVPPSPIFTSTPAQHSSPNSSSSIDLSSLSPSRTTPLTAKTLAAVPRTERPRVLSTPSERPLAHRLLSRTSSMGLSLGFESDRMAAWSSSAGGSSHGAQTDREDLLDDVE